ncbi:hypothetical protein CJE1687 [Campylobacter jejuni RM1221]|nr:hypothetical protein CJE1687 [Campylobacter jejuni RM1221]ADT73297.1 hypothetical protein CJS3_1594 [Campylobacter jejuni subsp. jejuni S3]KUY35552.1 hypothetical protein K691_0244 [Campylobacter jejuni HB-CJGB-XWM]
MEENQRYKFYAKYFIFSNIKSTQISNFQYFGMIFLRF